MKRKKKHVRYIERYLYDLKYDTLNKTFVASKEDFKNKEVNKSIKNNTVLLKKYERRLSLLNF